MTAVAEWRNPISGDICPMTTIYTAGKRFDDVEAISPDVIMAAEWAGPFGHKSKQALKSYTLSDVEPVWFKTLRAHMHRRGVWNFGGEWSRP